MKDKGTLRVEDTCREDAYPVSKATAKVVGKVELTTEQTDPKKFVEKMIAEIDQRRDVLGVLGKINNILDNLVLDPLGQIEQIIKILKKKGLR